MNLRCDNMSEDNKKWSNIAIGIFIILSVVVLILLILPLSNLAVESDEIAVVSIEGEISSNSTNIKSSPESIENALNDANSNEKVKAIVLEIDSEGGSLVASEEIGDLIKNSKKPVIAYIKDKSLNEAYLIASSCDYILSSNSSLIGGLGLSFANNNKYSKTELTANFDEKYLNSNKTNKINSDSSSLASAQEMINQDYTLFIKTISENRNLSTSYLVELSFGKIYNGNEALNVGLIDELGTKDKAISIAAEYGNTSNYTVVNYPKENKSLTETLNEYFNLEKFPID